MGHYSRQRASITWEAWMTVKSFIRAQPASIFPRRPRLCASYQVRCSYSRNLTSRSKFNPWAVIAYPSAISVLKLKGSGGGNTYVIRSLSSAPFPRSTRSCISLLVCSFCYGRCYKRQWPLAFPPVIVHTWSRCSHSFVRSSTEAIWYNNPCILLDFYVQKRVEQWMVKEVSKCM